MFGIGTTELIIILVIVLLIFGARKLPELARSLGQSAKEVRKGFDGTEDSKTASNKEATKS
jgi:sec-independent protein translocase protein TatA